MKTKMTTATFRFRTASLGLLASLYLLASARVARGQPGLGVRLTAGSPQLVITCPTGSVCQIQYLDQIAFSNQWLWLTSVLVSDSPCSLSDFSSSGAPQRFYRAQAVRPILAPVPGGSFSMGDAFGDLGADEVPVHPVTVSAFYIEQTEVSKALWDIVYSWATNNGYSFGVNVGRGKAPTHPVQTVSWHDAVKWCNARSQFEGLTPCYYTNETLTGLYLAGQVSLSNSFVNWAANGYRLPTEAEWERAARGGAVGMRFPWADTNVITHSRANYFVIQQNGMNSYAYDKSPTAGYHPAFTNAPTPYTSPCASFPANGFGIYDAAGNVWEWCWDWYDSHWYTNAAAMNEDTHGPEFVSAAKRVARGGSWSSNAPDNCCAIREGVTPSAISGDRGFRCVRRF